MGEFTRLNKNVSFGPAPKLCSLLMQGSIKAFAKGFVMAMNDSENKPSQITAFLGRLAYAAQAQEFRSTQSVDFNLNPALLYTSYCRNTEDQSLKTRQGQDYGNQTSRLATRIGCRPLYPSN